MAEFYLNEDAPPRGNHEVHTVDCTWIPGDASIRRLGEFSSGCDAIRTALAHAPRANPCEFCLPDIADTK